MRSVLVTQTFDCHVVARARIVLPGLAANRRNCGCRLAALATPCARQHALYRGATLAEVQSTLGHANVATASGYLHGRPNTSSGLKLDEGMFR
jgi:hypothetical protein